MLADGDPGERPVSDLGERVPRGYREPPAPPVVPDDRRARLVAVLAIGALDVFAVWLFFGWLGWMPTVGMALAAAVVAYLVTRKRRDPSR